MSPSKIVGDSGLRGGKANSPVEFKEVEDEPLGPEFPPRGGKRASEDVESPVVLLLCLDDDVEFSALFSGGNGDGTTLKTGGEAAGTAFISILRPSSWTTNSPTFELA